MSSKGLFSYVAMIVLAIGIAFFYIEPTFGEITKMQDDIALFQSERQKVDAVNLQLETLVDRLDNVSLEDQQKLLTYIPNEVDSIEVPSLLQDLTESSGLLLQNVGYSDVFNQYVNEAEREGINDYPTPHLFSVSVQGTYEQIKQMLRLLETNDYPLEVHNLDINVLQGNFLSADIQIITYSHVEPETSFFSI